MRRKGHLSRARSGRNLKFYCAIRKHGEDNFHFSVLEECTDYGEALAREVFYIDAYKPAYNCTRGGQGALGYKHSEEEIERMRERSSGRPGYWRGKKRPDLSEKMREIKLANPQRYWLGKTRDQETIDKISKAKTGVPRGRQPDHALEVFRENMRRAARARRKPVECINDGRRFDSAAAAGLAYGFSNTSVSKVCIGSRRAIKGIRFRYMEAA